MTTLITAARKGQVEQIKEILATQEEKVLEQVGCSFSHMSLGTDMVSVRTSKGFVHLHVTTPGQD